MILNAACICGLIAPGWVASKFHTIASKKWIPMKDHDNTVRQVSMNAKREEERPWAVN